MIDKDWKTWKYIRLVERKYEGYSIEMELRLTEWAIAQGLLPSVDYAIDLIKDQYDMGEFVMRFRDPKMAILARLALNF